MLNLINWPKVQLDVIIQFKASIQTWNYPIQETLQLVFIAMQKTYLHKFLLHFC